MKHYKPLYTTGLFVVALYGLTSFNPTNIYMHLAHLNQGSTELASASNPAPAAPPATANAAASASAINAAATSSANQGKLANYVESADQSTYKLNRSGAGFIYESSDKSTLKVIEFKRVDGTGTSGTSRLEITYQIQPSEEVSSIAGACDDCRDLLRNTRTVLVDIDYNTFMSELKLKGSSSQDAIIASALSGNFDELRNSLADISAEEAERGCYDLNYRDAKDCFEKRFELAAKCSRSKGRTSDARSRYRPRIEPRTERSTQTVACENAEDKESIQEDFHEWISVLALDDEMSDRRLKNLKRVDNSPQTETLINELLAQRKKVKEWVAYHKQYQQRLNEIIRSINSSTDAVQRQQHVLELKAGAQKYQRVYAAAFQEGAFDDLPETAAEILEERTDGIKSQYKSSMARFDGILETRFLEITEASSIVEIDSNIDIESLTGRNTRGQIEGYDYSSLRQSFAGSTNQNGQRTYNGQDPHMTQYNPQNMSMPQSRFQQTNTGRNWNNWRPNNTGMNNNYSYQQPQYQQQQGYRPPQYQQQPYMQQPGYRPPYQQQQPYANPGYNSWGGPRGT